MGVKEGGRNNRDSSQKGLFETTVSLFGPEVSSQFQRTRVCSNQQTCKYLRVAT